MSHKPSIYNVHNDDLDPQLDAAVWAVLSEPLPADAIKRVKTQALTVGDQLPPVSKSQPTILFTQRRWLQLASLAACALLVLGVTTMLPTASNAFAQAIERLKNVGAFRYKELVYVNSQNDPIEIDVSVSEDGRERRSMPGLVSICDSTGRVRLTIMEANRSAMIHAPIDGLHVDTELKVKWLERLKAYGKKPDKELGKMKIEGRDCVGFEVKPVPSAPHVVYAVWVDAESKELVQVEFTGMPKGSLVTKSVMKNFEFNVPLDMSLFSFDPPQGYKASTADKLPELLPFEESLVEALKGYTVLSGGKFPKSLTENNEWMTILSKDGVARTTLAARLGTLTPYLTTMSQEDYAYTGKDQLVDGKRAIVFWYRNPERQLRAVFNDFTTSTITNDELPSN
jgi:outer membrane lipoprotein-sorting protein